MPTPDIDIHTVQHPLVAGLAGAIVGLYWAPGSTWLQRATNVASGSLLAGYLGPAVAELLGQSSASAQSAIGFGLGLFGLSLAGSIVQAVREIQLADIIRGWISRPKE